MADADRCGAGLTYENLHPFIRELPFPAARDDIIQHAQSRGASQTIIGYLRNLPEKQYPTLEALSQECAAPR